jgi:hypothetical protein
MVYASNRRNNMTAVKALLKATKPICEALDGHVSSLNGAVLSHALRGIVKGLTLAESYNHESGEADYGDQRIKRRYAEKRRDLRKHAKAANVSLLIEMDGAAGNGS